jgi:hypothetical protein
LRIGLLGGTLFQPGGSVQATLISCPCDIGSCTGFASALGIGAAGAAEATGADLGGDFSFAALSQLAAASAVKISQYPAVVVVFIGLSVRHARRNLKRQFRQRYSKRSPAFRGPSAAQTAKSPTIVSLPSILIESLVTIPSG